MEYKKIAFAGFNPFVTGGIQHYVGLENEIEDYFARVNVLIESIKYAEHNWGKKYDSPETLKVFSVPEFFFRPKKGYYEEPGVINEIFELLSEETSKGCYENWLFIFGTVAATYKNTEDKKVALNTALILKGGIKKDQIKSGTNCFIVIKEGISNIDYPTIDNIIKLESSNNKSESNISGFNGGGVFTIDNIKFGLEICLDQTNERLKNEEIDIHLVCSAAMDYYSWKGKTMPKYAFYVDGGNNLGCMYKRTSTQSVNGTIINNIQCPAEKYVLLKKMELGELRPNNSVTLSDLFHRIDGEEYTHEDSVKGGFSFYTEYEL